MNPRGFILVEASITYLILSLALVALVPLFILSVRANTATLHVKVATQLSVELLEEIRLRKWDEKTPASRLAISTGSVIGMDSGASATDKRTFDDLDDFNGWSENPPLDPVMRPLTDFAGYSRSVTVSYVDAALQPVTGPTDYKQLSVCTTFPKLTPVCLNTLFTNR